MFEDLRKHTKIIVTGPHRAGTTIAATMIAQDTGHLLSLEEKCWLPNKNLELVDFWLNDYSGSVVIQAPFAADQCHVYKDALVVFMHRDLADIRKSERRMYAQDGRKVDFNSLQLIETRKYHTGARGEPIAQIKYRNWKHQKEVLPKYIELEYESLSEHPLWVPKEKRRDFHVRQTEIAKSGVG